MIGRLQDEAREIVDSVTTLAYFMRGGATFTEIMNMPYGIRERLGNFINKRLEVEQKSPYPVY